MLKRQKTSQDKTAVDAKATTGQTAETTPPQASAPSPVNEVPIVAGAAQSSVPSPANQVSMIT